jgi:hypothetical protein
MRLYAPTLKVLYGDVWSPDMRSGLDVAASGVKTGYATAC